MKVLKFIVLFIVLLMLSACPDYDQNFRFYNNSTREVYIYLGAISREFGGTLYPDTAISRVRAGMLYKQGSSFFYSYDSGKEDIWVDTLSLFIFDADTFNMYSWEEIQSGYKILQRYDISPENIKALKYNLSYPPTEAMKDIKMYPPYGQ